MIFVLIIMIIIAIIVITNYFTIKLAVNDARKENMSKIDFIKEKEYYRDILKNNSAAELSYIDDFKISPRREIACTILELQLKNKIKINNDNIEMIDSSEDGLGKVGKYILNSYKNGKFYISDLGYIYSYAQDEAVEDGLIELNSKSEFINRLIKKKILSVIVTIIYIIYFVLFTKNVDKINELEGIAKTITIISNLFVIILGGAILSIIGSPLYSFTYSSMQINSYHRTKKGEEINEKLEGLKKYIEDYSKLNEAEKDAIAIWDEFLIYSIIFDINKTEIEKMLMKYVKIENEHGIISINKIDRKKKHAK